MFNLIKIALKTIILNPHNNKFKNMINNALFFNLTTYKHLLKEYIDNKPKTTPKITHIPISINCKNKHLQKKGEKNNII